MCLNHTFTALYTQVYPLRLWLQCLKLHGISSSGVILLMKRTTEGISSSSTQPLFTVQDAAAKVGIMRTTLTSWIDAGLVVPQYSAGQNNRIKLFTAEGLRQIEQVQDEREHLRGQMRLPTPKRDK